MTAGVPGRVVVFGYGNVSRGDDAIGPLLLHRLDEAGLPGVVTVEDFQLQIEHALDLDGCSAALFLDAGTGTPAPFSFREVQPSGELGHTSHALHPATVLDVYVKMRGEPPPPSFVLCVRGESFGLGEDLTAAGAQHLEAAWAFLQEIAAAADPHLWRSRLIA